MIEYKKSSITVLESSDYSLADIAAHVDDLLSKVNKVLDESAIEFCGGASVEIKFLINDDNIKMGYRKNAR